MERDYTPNRVFTIHRGGAEGWGAGGFALAHVDAKKRPWVILYRPYVPAKGLQYASEYELVDNRGRMVRFSSRETAEARMDALFNETEHLHHHPRQGIKMPV